MQLSFWQILVIPSFLLLANNPLQIGNKQQSIFPIDAAGHILYYEIVEVPEIDKVSLSHNCRNFLMELHGLNEKKFEKQLGKRNGMVNWVDSTFTYHSKNKYIVYPGKFLKHAIGEVSYDMTVEIKEGKYRYYFNKFYYSPYELNRYGKYEPAPGKKMMLHTSMLAKEFIKQEDQYKIAAYLEEQIHMLKQIMPQKLTATVAIKEKEKVANISKDW